MDNNINGKNLLNITEDDLKNEFEISSLGHRKLIKQQIKGLKTLYSRNAISSHRLMQIIEFKHK